MQFFNQILENLLSSTTTNILETTQNNTQAHPKATYSEPQQTTLQPNLFWRLPPKENKNPNWTLEAFGKNVSRAFHRYKSEFPEYSSKNNYEDIAEQFCDDFFLTGFSNEQIAAYFANLSLKDNSERNITLSIRIPLHPIFNDKLPKNIAVSVIGLCPTDKKDPIFIPQRVNLTYGHNEKTDYEQDSSICFKQLEQSEFPPRNSNNALSGDVIKSLPKFGLKTKERLESWQEFLAFKDNLIKHKTQGIRYLEWEYLEETNQLQFLVISENIKQLNTICRAFNRQNLQAFNLNISTNEYKFILPQNNTDRLESSFRDFGQLASNKGKVVIDNNFSDKNISKKFESLRQELKKETKESNFNFNEIIFAYLYIDISEDLSYRISQLQDTQEDNESPIKTRSEKINEIFRRLPKTGFLSISLVGDLALTKRHKQAVKNLMQNENCYAPYLSSYLFDIENANEPENIPELPEEEWENKNLNDKQKSAVQKMLAAPDICLIQGPPGTGKTTVIAEACLQFAKRGETVLLASQAHDALDNALSRLQNNPNLRAIRLSKNADRITDEGKEFTGERVLAKQYQALNNYVSHEYLQPLVQLESDIKDITAWCDNAEFISYDLKNLRKKYKEKAEEIKTLEEQLNNEKNEYQRQEISFNNLQQEKRTITKLIAFLRNENDALKGLTIQSIDIIRPLTEKLYNLQASIKLNQKYTFSTFISELENQLMIFRSFYNQWRTISEAIPKMQADLDRLILGKANINTEAQIQYEELKEEISSLELKMENDDSDELAMKWRQKRKQLRELNDQITASSSNLIGEYYNYFEDKDLFLQKNDNEKLKALLHSRINECIKESVEIHKMTEQCVRELENYNVRKEIQEPNYALIKEQESKLSYSKKELEELKQQGINKKEKSIEFLQNAGFDKNQEFDVVLNEQKSKITQLKQELEQIKHQNKYFLPLFERWNKILKNPIERATFDWKNLEDTYIESCNVVAISCNENDRTLTDKGFDSFDVVIIDEVSKATPLELLLPLMRAKKAILVGDHRQLPPIFNEADGLTFEDEVEQNEAVQEENVEYSNTELTKENLNKFERMVTASLFKELFEKAPDSLRERLNIQFRMHPEIMRMINFFYEDTLSCGNPNLPRSHGLNFANKNEMLLSKNDHLLWIDTTDDETGKRFKIEKGNNINRLEARLIARTLLSIDQQAIASGEYNKNNKLKVGVVSFYQPQCRVIREEIRKLVKNKKQNQWFNAIDVEINTVIRYQGKEKPIILLSLVKNNGGDLSQKFRAGKANIARFEFINVAMSRAQNLLMVFGARNMLENREVKLPKMDQKGYNKSTVYKNMFNYLEYQSKTGNLTTSETFAKSLPILK